MADWIQGIAQEIPNFVEASRRLERERDEWRKAAFEITRQANKSREEIERELDEARAEIERLQKGGCARDQRTTQFCAEAVSALRERDEALELAQQMSESNQVLLADVRFYRSAWEQLKKKNHE